MNHISILVTPSRFNRFFRFGWFGVSWCWIFLTTTRTTTANCKKWPVFWLHALLIEEFDKWPNRSNPGLENTLMISVPLVETCCSSRVVRVDVHCWAWKIAIKWGKNTNQAFFCWKVDTKRFKQASWQKKSLSPFDVNTSEQPISRKFAAVFCGLWLLYKSAHVMAWLH